MARPRKRPTRGQIARFVAAAGELDELAGEGCFLYLAGDTLHLMTGESHDDRGRPRPDRIVASVLIRGSGGGDW